MEVTKREVLASVTIVAIMLLFGFLISGRIQEAHIDQNEAYNKAIKIDSADVFEYGIRTNVGNAFVYGDLEAVDKVTYPEIGGEYMYARKVKEVYTMHTLTVKTGKTVRVQTYWTWDYAGEESIKCKEVTFCGMTFDSGKIDIPGAHYIDTIKEGSLSNVRYVYYGVDSKQTGTIFTDLRNGTISDNSTFWADQCIDDVTKVAEFDSWNGLFWFSWIVMTIGVVVGFYYLENRWLE